MANLTPVQEQQLRSAFNLFDANRSGEISQRELKKVLKALGIKANDSELQILTNQMDKDGSGKIDYHEFQAVMASRYFRQHSQEQLKIVFDNYDSDGNGFLTLDELQNVMKKMGRHMTLNEIKSMVKSLDTNNDGKISFNEFNKLFE